MFTLSNLRQMLAQSTLAEVAELDRAINQAIQSVKGEMFYHVNPPPTITLVADTWEYSLSAITNLARVSQLIMADSAGDYDIPIPDWDWYLIAGPTLVFDDKFFTPIAGRLVRIICQAVQPSLSLTTDTLNIDDEYVLARARAIINMDRALPASPDSATVNPNAATHVQIGAYWEAVASRARMTHHFRPDPSSKRVPGAY